MAHYHCLESKFFSSLKSLEFFFNKWKLFLFGGGEKKTVLIREMFKSVHKRQFMPSMPSCEQPIENVDESVKTLSTNCAEAKFGFAVKIDKEPKQKQKTSTGANSNLLHAVRMLHRGH